MAKLFMYQKEYARAKTYLQQAIKYADDSRRVVNYAFAYRAMYEVSDSLQEYKNALRYYKLANIYTDSVMSIDMKKQAEVKQLRFEFETKEVYLKNDHEKQMAVEQAKQQKQIVDSINYAQHIQQSILPDEAEIKTHLKDFFVFYQPKDIVSGDFYWFAAHGSKLFFVTVDCTGHGVPGAFLSMIGNTLLNEIVNFKKITNPMAIIEKLAQGLSNTLSHKEKNEAFVDGMDISICKIDTETKKLSFSSVNHAAYTVYNNEITPLDPQVKSVHGIFAFESRKDTGITELTLPSGTMVYMGTDGYGDQVGQETKKKFMAPRVKELLLQIHQLPIDEQKAQFEKTFLNWKGKRKQNDDILVMGFRIP